MSNFLRNAFTKPDATTVTVDYAEYEQLKAERDYYLNRVRQLEGRLELVEKGRDKQGEVIWGTPSRGLDVESLRAETA